MRTLLKLTLSILVVGASLTARAQNNTIFMGEFTDKATGYPVRVSIPTATDAEIRANSPAVIHEKIAAQCRKGGFDWAGWVRSLPAEVFVFNTALAINAVLMSEGQPAPIGNFAQNSLYEPTAHASFVAFTLANRGVQHMLTTAMPDFCKGIPGAKRQPIKLGVADYKIRSNPAFRKFLLPYFGMASGMAASHLVTDLVSFMKNPAMHQCTKLMLTRNPDMKKLRESCDQSYGEFFSGRKWRVWAPIFGSLGVTMVAQGAINAVVMGTASGVASTAAAGRNYILSRAAFWEGRMIVPLLVNTVNIASYLGGGLRVGLKFGYGVANLLTFMFLDHKIMELIKPPWDSYWERHGLKRKITEINSEIERTEKNAWVWKPKPKTCTVPDHEKNMRSTFSWKVGVNFKTVDCTERNKNLQYFVDEFAKHNVEFRKVILEGPLANFEMWKEHAIRFMTLYNATYTFDRYLIDSVAGQRFLDSRKPGDSTYEQYPPGYKLPLMSSTPENGIHVAGMVNGRIAKFAVKDGKLQPATSETEADTADAIAVRRAIAYSDRVLKGQVRAKLNPQDRHTFLQIRHALLLGYSSVKLDGEGNPNSPLEKRLAQYPRSEREYRLRDEKYKVFERAMNTLVKKLPASFPRLVLRRNIRDDVINGADNPFVGLYIALGTPTPLPVGMKAIDDFDNSPMALDQATKVLHPTRTGIFGTYRMVDYLMVKAACGIKATRDSQAVAYDNMRLPFVDRIHKKINMIKPVFNPPKLINENVFFCQQTDLADADKTGRGQVPLYSHWAEQQARDKTKYPNLLTLIKANLRRDLFGKALDESNFENWWKAVTDKATYAMTRRYEGELLKVINKQFVPALVGKGPLFKDPSQYKIQWSLTDFSTISARDAYLNEAAFYLNTIIRINYASLQKKYAKNPKMFQQETNKFRMQVRNVFKRLQVASALLGTSRQTLDLAAAGHRAFGKGTIFIHKMSAEQQADYVDKVFRMYLSHYLKGLSEVIRSTVRVRDGAHPTQVNVIVIASKKLLDMSNELKGYFDVLSYVRVGALKKVDADDI